MNTIFLETIYCNLINPHYWFIRFLEGYVTLQLETSVIWRKKANKIEIVR